MRVPPKPVSTDTIPPGSGCFAALMVSLRFRGCAAPRAESLRLSVRSLDQNRGSARLNRSSVPAAESGVWLLFVIL